MRWLLTVGLMVIFVLQCSRRVCEGRNAGLYSRDEFHSGRHFGQEGLKKMDGTTDGLPAGILLSTIGTLLRSI